MKYGIEVKLVADFKVIIETLERIGVANRKTMCLYPSVYIFKTQGKFYLCHFKELLAHDGHPSTFDETDKKRRDSICKMLENWNLLKIVDRKNISDTHEFVKIISHNEKSKWTIKHKYTFSKNNKK